MAKEGNLTLSDSQLEEKYDYKAIVYKKAKSADWNFSTQHLIY